MTEPGTPRIDPGHSLSEVLWHVAHDPTRDRVTVGDLLQVLGDRAIGALIFIFAFPNALPAPPGVSAVLGTPLLFLTMQLTLGLRPWLPAVVARRSLARADFAMLVRRVAPWLARAERLLRPRFSRLALPPFEYAIGLVTVVMAIVLVLPIPLGNMLPALALCVMALGILARDGVWIAAGVGLAGFAIAVIWGVLLALLQAALFLMGRWLS